MELQLRLPGEWPVGRHRRAAAGEPDQDDLEAVLTWPQAGPFQISYTKLPVVRPARFTGVTISNT